MSRRIVNRGTKICGIGVLMLAIGAVPALAQEAANRNVGGAALPDPEHMARVEASVDRARLSAASAERRWFVAKRFQRRVEQRRQRPVSAGVSRSRARPGVAGHTSTSCRRRALPHRHAAGQRPVQIAQRFARPDVRTCLGHRGAVEAYGFVPTPELRQRVQKAVDLIVKSQNKQGGWRYQPVPSSADLSVTVMQVVALHAAIDARLDVPDKTMKNALNYVKLCAVKKGGFGYQPGGGPGRVAHGGGHIEHVPARGVR